MSYDCSTYIDLSQKNTIVNSFTQLTLIYFDKFNGIYTKNVDAIKPS